MTPLPQPCRNIKAFGKLTKVNFNLQGKMPFYRQPVTLKKASTLAILAAIQARPYSEINSCLNIASLRELVLLVHS